MSDTATTNSNQEDDETDLLALAKTLWSYRRKVFWIILAFFILGLSIAFLTPKTFTASSTFILKTADSGKASGSLGGLASLAGISLGGIVGGSEVPPALYPKFVSSVYFRRALLDAKIALPGTGEKVTYREYYTKIHSPHPLALLKNYTLGLPGKIVQLLRGKESDGQGPETASGLVRISKEERVLFSILEGQLTVTPNEKEGLVTIAFDMPDPVMAAQMASYAEALLQKEVIAYKIQNAREQLTFTEEQFAVKKAEFEEVQAELARFRDRNQNIISASVNNELQRLEAEYNFAFTIYSELAKQLEQAKLQVSKDTPIFSIIEPVTVPYEKSGPKRPLILAIFLIVGAIVGVGYVLGAEFLKGVRDQWNALG